MKRIADEDIFATRFGQETLGALGQTRPRVTGKHAQK
jgi:hypothetical protein